MTMTMTTTNPKGARPPKRFPAMKRLLSFLLWTAVFCCLLLAFDQLLVRLPWQRPAALAAVRDFYVDFRERLLHLSLHPAPSRNAPVVKGSEPKEGAPVLRPAAPPKPKPTAKAPAASPTPAASSPAEQPGKLDRHPSPPPMRYVYVDGSGTLQFADRLEAVPAAFRKAARPMEP